MRQLKILEFLICVFVLEFFTLNHAYATPSTHIWSPSTDVQPYKKWHLTADFYVPTESNSDGSRANTFTVQVDIDF